MSKLIKTKTSSKDYHTKTNKCQGGLMRCLLFTGGFIKARKILLSLLAILAVLFILVSVYWFAQKNGADNKNLSLPEPENNERLGLSNPASLNCLELGGNLEMKKKSTGDEYGVCLFSNGFQCEEWAMFNGDCLAGGVDVTEYANEWDYYCAVSGGLVLPGDNCKVSEDITCNSEDYYLGRCRR